jgi:hypothetical protein
MIGSVIFLAAASRELQIMASTEAPGRVILPGTRERKRGFVTQFPVWATSCQIKDLASRPEQLTGATLSSQHCG